MSTENNLKSCSFCVGNAAAMLKALRYIIKQIDKNPERLSAGQLLCIIGDKAEAALSAPPRNCDVGDAGDWEKRFGEECDNSHTCSDCPVRRAKTGMAIEFDKGARCEFVWAQMPYEAQEGDGK